ncbi:MAG TPA: ABC transporter permease [Shinella sp.]|jgi:peptide/nickel transport system permease protein|uniref:ABC transporter permease n=1 Tax=Shinella sp. TaxID=1870904 RepID=UPI0029A6EB54|nr:ABC transporter permease [Shinella sp.]MDX3974763.1 ABC transporter permease [Shinella sp.]HEV7247281.1 ABC transporter permease [Shinella sp.]
MAATKSIARTFGNGLAFTEMLAIGFVMLFFLAGLCGPYLIDFNPVATDTAARLKPPMTQLADGSIAWFGTDAVGRDVAKQVLYGARVSLLVGFTAAALAAAFGVIVGVWAGWAGGRTEQALMRFVDIQLAFPSILIAVFLAAFIQPSLLSVILILAVTRWAVVARVARAITARALTKSYVEAAIISGESTWRIVRDCILPNIWIPLLILMSAELSLIILAEASLGFLGLGTPVDVPSWGRIISSGRNHLANAWWIATMPGLVIVVVVVSIGVTGEVLRRRLGKGVSAAL